MSVPKKRLGDILIDCNLITQEQLKEALAYQRPRGLKLGEALNELKMVTEDDIIWALGNQLNISFIHLNPDIVDRAVIKAVTPEFALEHRVIPLYQAGSQISVCMVDPLDSDAIEFLATKTQMEISISICSQADFEETFRTLYGSLDVDEKAAHEPAEVSVPTGEQQQTIEKTLERTLPSGMESPEKVINFILGQAILNNVDRIHFEPTGKGVIIRFRSCSTLTRKLEIPIKIHHEVINKLKSLSHVAPTQLGTQQGVAVGHFRVTVSGRMINIQAIFYPTVNAEMTILKLSDFGNVAALIDQSSRQQLDEISRFVRDNHGVLYISGPRESGRTTTHYYLLTSFDVEHKKIVTVEDPVQSSLPQVTQIQIGQNGIDSMHVGLNLALLLDPDIIYLDALDSPDLIADIAFAAIGGKTVLTSFMAYDAPSSIVHLLDQVSDPVIVARSMAGFLSQRLIRTLCPKCKMPSSLPSELQQRLVQPDQEIQVFAAQGCDCCHNTGYSSRTLITEFIPTSPIFTSMVINRQTYQDYYQYIRKQGIPTLEDKALGLVISGETAVDEFLRLF